MTHALVLERVAQAGLAVGERIRKLVHPDQQRALGHVGLDVQRRLALQRGHALAGRIGDEVHPVGQQGLHPGLVVGHGLVDDGIGVARKAAGIPPAGMALQLQGLSGSPAILDAVGAGAVGVACGVADGIGLGARNGIDLVFARPAAAENACVGEDPGQQGHRSVQHDVHGEIVDAAHAADVAQHGAHGAAGRLQALQRILDVIGGQRAAIVKAYAFAQMEAPGQRRDLFPAGGQRRFDVQVGRIAGQPLVHVLQHGLGL